MRLFVDTSIFVDNLRLDAVPASKSFLGSLGEEYEGISEEQFLESYKDVQAAKFSLLECTEACVDIANHIGSAFTTIVGIGAEEGEGQVLLTEPLYSIWGVKAFLAEFFYK